MSTLQVQLPRLRDLLFAAIDTNFDIRQNPTNALLRAFRCLDSSRSGAVSRSEWDQGLARLGVWLPITGRRTLFTALDRNQDELVNLADLTWLWEANIGLDEVPSSGKEAQSESSDLQDDSTGLALAQKLRRVRSPMGAALQKRFVDYAVGDALLCTLEGLPASGAAVEGPCILDEELVFVLSQAQCPISREEMRWLARTFSFKEGNESAYRSELRIAGGPLANFAFGARDPWANSNVDALLFAVTPEECDSAANRNRSRSLITPSNVPSQVINYPPYHASDSRETQLGSSRSYGGSGVQIHVNHGEQTDAPKSLRRSTTAHENNNEACSPEFGSFLWCLSPRSPQEPADDAAAHSHVASSSRAFVDEWDNSRSFEAPYFDQRRPRIKPPESSANAKLRRGSKTSDLAIVEGRFSSMSSASELHEPHQVSVQRLSGLLRRLYRCLASKGMRPAAAVQELMETADADCDGYMGVEDLLLLALAEEDAVGSAARTPVPAEAAKALIERIKAEAGLSVGSMRSFLTPGELSRWLAPLSPQLSRVHATCVASLVASVQRDWGKSWWRMASQAERTEAVANLLRAASVRAGAAKANSVYDGAIPPGLVSVPAFRKAVQRLGLPLSASEVDSLAACFRAREPEGPNGSAVRNVDFDAIVLFLLS